VDRFDSQGFTIGSVVGSDGPVRISQARLAPGGVIGRHPAVRRQLLIPLDGDVTVSGQDGVSYGIGPGRAALWEPGEEHETRTADGLWALVVEGNLTD